MTDTIEFEAFPKLQRLHGPWIVTEKIDGTNAAIIIKDGIVAAQSRTRIITPGKQTDNMGFAGWVEERKEQLITLLGEGRHFGEFWGGNIQRGYGVKNKRFSLFNTTRFNDPAHLVLLAAIDIFVVPVMYVGKLDTFAFEGCMLSLKNNGSLAAPGFMNPEGIVIYDTRQDTGYKVTFDYDEKGKGLPKDIDGNTVTEKVA